ncbi:Alcohol dehydrogenase [Pseudovibrio axinellae]|uniref:Alcohol dehydrogenase n=1 Tax=Pseudovibrio axinellae TaxID=989403 RepID=A0A165YN00_9HYPH|nr:NAD(P)-dependent alcohol dehydrogenase [Pseudovibrio axinellae]KZL19000.1 Alcohol dehydrogenase [Pseudovibrio axinellae]SEP84412.1 NADPH:quinone reductase [Pseudovibrio axinellae]
MISEQLTSKTHRQAHMNEGTFSLAQAAPSALGAHEVRLHMAAASVNSRDLMIAKGAYGEMPADLVPLSDGAGTIVEVGSNVSNWKVGDKVMPSFFQDWHEGRFEPGFMASALSSAERPGVLRDFAVFHEDTLVRVPDHLTLEEAATLPCAAVTAWHALFETHRTFSSEDTVLIQGTGGVAIFALQFAKTAGAKVILLSSSDEKLERARQMGADTTINYKKVPLWDQEVLKSTNGKGADIVLDLGGKDTLEKSINAVAAHGIIAQVGVLTGWAAAPQNISHLIFNNSSISGVLVGSRTYLERVSDFMSQHTIKPVIHQRFQFEGVQQAYACMKAAGHFGKITVTINE